ncbi:MAG: hypothetical protein AB1656_19735 [Candidatus Omnitrophota bacterium]
MKNTLLLGILIGGLFGLLEPLSAASSDSLLFNFESGDLQGWKVVDGKFDDLVCRRVFFHNQPDVPYNKQGKFFLSTLECSDGRPNDAMTGVIESPVFILTSGAVSFLIGGGDNADTYAALCMEQGEEVLTAHGDNSETMRRVEWDANPYIGQKLFLRVVDKNPGGWGHLTFDDFRAEGRIDAEASRMRFAEAERIQREKKRREWMAALTNGAASLRQAVADLSESFGKRYPKGRDYLTRLGEIEKKANQADFAEWEKINADFDSLRREALIANPLVTGQPILYVVRPQYLPDHHSTETMFQNGEINTASFRGGGALKTIDFGAGGIIETIADLPEGVARDPEIDFDAKKILFSMRRNQDDDYHIYEYDRQSGELRQLTFGSHLTDIDPIYTPTGQIVFVSTREPKYCQCNRHIMGNLFMMDADGSLIRQLGRNTLFEGHPSLMPDGRILYERWEYVDKHFGPAFGLWTVNPDGTNHAVYYGNNAWTPGAILDARIVPGTQQAIATFGSCHDRPWGAIAIIDRRFGLDGEAPVVRSWPEDIHEYLINHCDYKGGQGRNHPAGGQIDNFTRLPIKYEDPYPLSDKYFLCSRMIEGERMGLFLLDIFGNEILLHEEGAGCYDPMPLTPRPRPPVIPPRHNYADEDGYFYVANVYAGNGMEAVPRGAVKTLRIVEAPVKLFWTQPNWNLDATQAPAMNFNSTNNKRILGSVPVEADGSAYFAVPADVFVFFQLLDEKGMMIQSMRSGTMVQPGETAGCIGCHDNRLTTAENRGYPLALRRDPSRIESWYGPPREFNYLTEVQPVFDRYCIRCHDYGKEAGERLNLSGGLGLAFNNSYLELKTKSALRWFPDPAGAPKLLVKAVEDGPAEALPPYSWGSHRSRLADVLRGEHHGVQVDKESFDRVITWIDLNTPYYGSYASVYPNNAFGRSPLDDAHLEELRRLTGVNVGDISSELNGSQVDFSQPEYSRCLARLRDKNPADYEKALAIIHKGQEMLAKRPRMDQPDASLLEENLKKQEKYLVQIKTEAEVRRLLLNDKTIKSENKY